VCSPQLGWRPSYVHPKKHDMTERGAQVAPRARPIDGAGSQRARPIDGAGSPRARPSTESRARRHGTARKQTQRSVEPTLETSRQASWQRHREIDFILLEAGADRKARQAGRTPAELALECANSPRSTRSSSTARASMLARRRHVLRVRSLMMRVRSLSSACGHAERAARARVHASRVRHLDQPSCDVDGDRFPLPS
jgi:hypothetical protein